MRLRSLAIRTALLFAATLLGGLAPITVAAQGGATPEGPAKEVHKALGPADIIMTHITYAKHFEVPCVHGLRE